MHQMYARQNQTMAIPTFKIQHYKYNSPKAKGMRGSKYNTHMFSGIQ